VTTRIRAGPGVEVSAKRSARWKVTSSALDERTRSDLEISLREFSRRGSTRGSATITIESMPPLHIGMGTKTALVLAALVAAQSELGIECDAEGLMAASGRGGTSGIGIHGFFKGGFLVDAGHPQEEIARLSPSSSRRPARPPMLVERLAIPERWRFHLVVPPGISRYGRREARFFNANTPIPSREVHEAISATYHGLVPAVIEADLDHLGEALAKLHRLGFKARELAGQPAGLRAAYQRLLKEGGGPVGLSSMGPVLYVVLDVEDDRSRQAISRVCADTGAAYLGVFAGLSDGYRSL